MKFIEGCENYMWVYGYYIDDIQSFLAYAHRHTSWTKEDWENLVWIDHYEDWLEDNSLQERMYLISTIASGG